MGDDGHELLGQHVEGVARKAGGLDLALVHGPGDGGAGDEVGPVLGEKNALADGVDVVAGTANALHAAGHRGRGFDLNNKIDGTHVDAQFEGGGGAQGLDLARLQLLFDHRPLGGGQRSVMGSGDGFSRQFVERTGKSLGHLAAVDEEDGRVPLPDQLQQARMDGVPDGGAARCLRGRSTGDFLHGIEARHIFDRNFNSQL